MAHSIVVETPPSMELDSSANLSLHAGYAFSVMGVHLVFFKALPLLMRHLRGPAWAKLGEERQRKFCMQVCKTVVSIYMAVVTFPVLTYRAYAGLWGTVNTIPAWGMATFRVASYAMCGMYTYEVCMQPNAPALQWLHHAIVMICSVLTFAGSSVIAPEFIGTLAAIAAFEAPSFGVMAAYYLTSGSMAKYRAMIFNHYFYMAWTASCTPLMVYFLYSHWAVLTTEMVVIGVATLAFTFPMQLYATGKFRTIAMAALKSAKAEALATPVATAIHA